MIYFFVYLLTRRLCLILLLNYKIISTIFYLILMYITVDVFYYMTGHYICQLKIQKNFVYNPQSKSPLYLLQYFSYL